MDVLLQDNDVLPILGGLKVIHIPGHTPGHIALYALKEKVLLAADLFRYSRGAFHLCPPQFVYSWNYVAHIRSMLKVASYDFDIAVPYHGEPIKGKADEKYREFIEYLRAISEILLPEIREALAPEAEVAG